MVRAMASSKWKSLAMGMCQMQLMSRAAVRNQHAVRRLHWMAVSGRAHMGVLTNNDWRSFAS